MSFETLAMAVMFPLHAILGCVLSTALLLVFGDTTIRVALLLYFTYVFFDKSPEHGGFPLFERYGITQKLRRLILWRTAANYFPVKLVKTADLKPGEAHIFVCHPHGIVGCAPMTNFGTDVTGFSTKFAGIEVHLLGHSAIFRIPFFRDWCLMHGHGTVSKKTCLGLLKKGHSIALAPGGAKESLDAEPGTLKLFLKQRLGFCRLAVQTGAALVPCISFGENEVYTMLRFSESSPVRWLQNKLQQYMGFALPVFVGRYWAPFMPKRGQIVQVCGKPIYPNLRMDSVDDLANELHEQYCSALTQLFEEHKAAYGYSQVRLELV